MKYLSIDGFDIFDRNSMESMRVLNAGDVVYGKRCYEQSRDDYDKYIVGANFNYAINNTLTLKSNTHYIKGITIVFQATHPNAVTFDCDVTRGDEFLGRFRGEFHN